MSKRNLIVSEETAKVVDLHTEFQQWDNKLIGCIREQHGEDGFGDVYGHVMPHLKAVYDVLRYEIGHSMESQIDVNIKPVMVEESKSGKVNEEMFLMCTSVLLAKECLEDIEEIKDGNEYVERMLEAHKHLTEAVEIFEAHKESDNKSEEDKV